MVELLRYVEGYHWQVMVGSEKGRTPICVIPPAQIPVSSSVSVLLERTMICLVIVSALLHAVTSETIRVTSYTPDVG
ncbi:hypothetical protein DSECCO2_608090 [anaerobic digester metagenome]